MSAALIIQLLETFGPSAIKLIDGLILKFETKGDVTAAEWASLRADGSQTAKDRMIAMLNQAGIDLNSEQGKAFIAAAS